VFCADWVESMLDLDIARLSPEVARIMLLRAADSEPLQWHEHKNLGAKRGLEAIDDAKLFGPGAVVDEGMATAVRALLYIWNGWIGEGKMYAQAAPEQERFHITAFCERMQGNGKAAKEYFQKAGEIPLYSKMQSYAMSIIGPGASPEMHRFRKVLEMIQGWEPYAFCDLYMQAVSGQLGTGAVLGVANLQNREFELLFVHCYEKAAGTDFSKKAVAKPAKRKQEKKRPKTAGARRGSHSSTRGPASDRTGGGKDQDMSGKTGSSQDGRGESGAARLKVICPSCRERLMFAGSERGAKHTCPKCSARFIIPSKRRNAPAPTASAGKDPPRGGVRVLCPKCREITTFPGSMRGQQESCPQCAATFFIPQERARPVPSG